MAEEQKTPTTESEEQATPTSGETMVGRLSKRGEEALNRLIDELGQNQRVSDAVGRAMEGKGRIETAGRKALGQVGVAASDELKELRRHIERLEQRLARLEGAPEAAADQAEDTAKVAETKTTASAKKGTVPASEGEEETGPAPSPGRSIGGGSGRGSTPG